MPSKGTYGFYKDVKPTKGPEIVKAYEKSKLLAERSKREDEKLALSKKVYEAQKKKANQIEIKAIDEFNAFAGRIGAAGAKLTSQAGQILIGAKRMVESGAMTKDQYKQIEINLQAGVHTYNEVSTTRKEQYEDLMALDANDYKDGALKEAQELARQSFMKTVNVNYNNDGTLYYMGEDGKKQSVGEFYSSTEMPSMIAARRDVLGSIRTGIKPAIISQILAQDPSTGMWYAKPIKGDTELATLIMADANISSFKEGTVARQAGYNYEDQIIANNYQQPFTGTNDEVVKAEEAKLQKKVQSQTDDQVYSLYTNAAQNKAKELNEAIKKGRKDKVKETYYPALEKTIPYNSTYLDSKVRGLTAIIDTSKISGNIAKEEIIGQVVEMDEGNPVIEDGKYRVETGLAEVKGMTGQVKQIIKIDNDLDENGKPYYYIQMVSSPDKDFSSVMMAGGVTDKVMQDMLKKYRNHPIMLRVNEQEMKVIQARIPNALGVFSDQTSQSNQTNPLGLKAPK